MTLQQNTQARAIFLDFEASSLMQGSFPIEVAWVNESGQGEAYLIRPAPCWLDEALGHPGWSRESQAIHGIKLATLMSAGVSHERVASRAARILAAPNVVVCSDAPEFDSFWLRTLFSAAGLPTKVAIEDVADVYVRACLPLLRLLPPAEDAARPEAELRVRGIASEIIANAEHQESLRPRTQHRALPDAESLWRAWRTICSEVDRRLPDHT